MFTTSSSSLRLHSRIHVILLVSSTLVVSMLLISCRNGAIDVRKGNMSWDAQLRWAYDTVQANYPNYSPVLTRVSAVISDNKDIRVETIYEFHLSGEEYVDVWISNRTSETILHISKSTHYPNRKLVVLPQVVTSAIRLTPYDAFMITQRKLQQFEERYPVDVANKSIHLKGAVDNEITWSELPAWEVRSTLLIGTKIRQLVIVVDAATGQILEQEETLMPE